MWLQQNICMTKFCPFYVLEVRICENKSGFLMARETRKSTNMRKKVWRILCKILHEKKYFQFVKICSFFYQNLKQLLIF